MLPLGKLAILDGDPGLGKSVLTIEIIARLTTGRPMPGVRKAGPASSVVMVCAEDDVDDTIVPRLDAASADRSKVFTHAQKRDPKTGEPLPLTIPEDMATLRGLVRKSGAVLLVIDPITAFMSEEINTHNDASTRRAMLPLTELAAATGCCVLMVRHLNKDTTMGALHRGGGSMAFIGAARSGLLVGQHPEDHGLVVLAQTKSNLARSLGRSFCYRVESWDEDPRIATVEWEGDTTITADDLVRKPDARTEAPACAACWEDMRNLFEETDAWAAKEMTSLLLGNGYSKNTIERTRKRNNVLSERMRDAEGRTTGWSWSLGEVKFQT
jgi:hypothetical protein